MKRVKYIFYVAVSLSADQLDLVCGVKIEQLLVEQDVATPL